MESVFNPLEWVFRTSTQFIRVRASGYPPIPWGCPSLNVQIGNELSRRSGLVGHWRFLLPARFVLGRSVYEDQKVHPNPEHRTFFSLVVYTPIVRKQKILSLETRLYTTYLEIALFPKYSATEF